jgi:acyl-CoA hydrolase
MRKHLNEAACTARETVIRCCAKNASRSNFRRIYRSKSGGKPIIALGSVTRKGESKIVPVIRSGAGIVTSRAHMHWLITEYGAVNLFGKNLRQRAYEIMRIAHPDHRERLEQEIIKRFGSNTYPVH